jgi:hypothetical protein
MFRRLTAAFAALTLLLILAVPVAAGGWAEIVADAQTTTTDPPVEGQPIDIGFLVLQHGETPAGWETATVHFTNASTGKTMDVVATNDRPDGHFLATVTLPEAGFWSWQVTLQDLESQHLPVALTVRTAAGEVPGYDPAMAAGNQVLPEIARLEAMIRAEQVRTDGLTAQVTAITSERDALAARLATAEDAGGIPILAVLTLAVLAGAAAGFAMAWLAGRPGPTVKVSPAPRGVDPA